MDIPNDYPENVIHTDPQGFVDPLSNYDPPVYEDDLERDLCEGQVGEMLRITPFAIISPDVTIEDTVRRMANEDSFALMVVEDGKLLGVVSERDVLDQVAERYDEVKGMALREVMTPEPAVVYANDPPAKAINLMATGGFRRLPVLDEDDRIVGILGPKRVTVFLFQHI